MPSPLRVQTVAGRVHRCTAFALATLVALAAGACDRPPGPTGDPGPAAAERHVSEYVAALNSADPARLGSFLDEPAGSSAVTTRLERYGGLGLTVLSVRARAQFPRVYTVVIEADGADGGSVAWQEVLEWDGARWDFAPLTAEPSTRG